MTLKQIITRLETLARSHRQVNYYFLGGADEFLDQEDVTYPAIFIDAGDGNISIDNRQVSVNFTAYFFDLMDVADKSLNNQWEVTNDMMQLAQDYAALLKDKEFYDWDVSLDFNTTINEYQLQDLACGVGYTFIISTRYNANICAVPSTYVWTEDDNDYLTYKQVLGRLQSLAIHHKQINTFVLGRFNTFLDGSDVRYPALFIDPERTGSLSESELLYQHSFTLYFFDLLDIADNALLNEWEVKSDMLSVAMDYIAMLNYTGFQHTWTIDSEAPISIKDYQLQDLTAGVSVRVTIGTRFDANKCQVPTVEEMGNFIIWNNTDKILINNTEKLLYG